MSSYIYNRQGNAALRLVMRDRFVDISGRSVGFLDGTSIYDYNGIHRGWFEDGILRDQTGAVVGFMKGASGPSPLLPLTRISPLPRLVQLEPLRPLKAIKPIKPLKRIVWSNLDPITIFNI